MKKDVVIIGAGIAGLTAALFLKRANKEVIVIEKNMPGGAINTTSSVKNYPGIPFVSGPEFSMLLIEQAEKNEIEIKYSTVIGIENNEKTKKVILPDSEIECKYIILSTGKETRKLGVEGEQELTGHGVSYCALCDGPLYKEKNVIVVGTGTSALEEALYLSNICKTVTIMAKYNYFKCEDSLKKEIEQKENIKVMYETFITKINGETKVESVDYKNDENINNLKIDGIFIYIGSTPNIFANLNIELDGNYIKVDENMKTSLDGIYACGDNVKKNLYQLVTAASDGAIAATSVIKELNKK